MGHRSLIWSGTWGVWLLVSYSAAAHPNLYLLCPNQLKPLHGPLTRYVKLRVAHAPGMPGTFSRHRLQRKRLVSDPGMHHGTCVAYVPWCMSGSLNHGGWETFPEFPAYAQPAVLRIRQQTHIISALLARISWWCYWALFVVHCKSPILEVCLLKPFIWNLT